MERTIKPLIMEGDRPFLPDDVMVNILKRFSVKSLIRFQCVCKRWQNLIKEPSFIAEHHCHSSHQTPLILLRCCRFRSPGFRWFLLDCDMRELVVQSPPLSNHDIYGSSNGLLCLDSESPNSILLWNPATREVRQVPININDLEGECYIGFGFSPIVNDYKIVAIYAQYDGEDWRVYRVEVYSLHTKRWKEVEFGNLGGLSVSPDTVSVNGHVFWFGYKWGRGEDDGYYWVVSFDIAHEEFTLIPMPPQHDILIQRLTVYENNLALLWVKGIAPGEFCLELWVMEEGSGTFGERGSWTNKYSSLCPGMSMLHPVTIWSDEIICQPEVESEFDSEGEEDEGSTTSLYLYNLASNDFKTFAIRGCDFGYDLQIYNYVESLVSIGNIPC